MENRNTLTSQTNTCTQEDYSLETVNIVTEMKSEPQKRTRSESSTPSISQSSKKQNMNDSDKFFQSYDLDSSLDFDTQWKLHPSAQSPSASVIIDKSFNNLVMEALDSEIIKHLIENLVEKKIDERLAHYEERICYLQGSVDTLISKVGYLEETNETLKSKISSLEANAEKQEQYSRRTSLRITNNWRETKDENTEQLILNLANESLNTLLVH